MSASNQLAAFNYAVQPLSNLQIKNITAAYTVSPSDNNFILNCTSGTFTISMPPASTFPSGFNFCIKNYGSGAITIDPNASEDIDDYLTIILRPGESVQIFCIGTAWRTNNGQYQQGMSLNRQPGAGRPIASATNSAAIGSNSSGNASQAVTGQGAMALGGSYASGTDSFAAGVASNSSAYGATGANSVAVGYRATSSASKSTAIGGETSTASAGGATAIGGEFATASGAFSVALGGSVNTASGEGAYAFGKRAQAVQVQKYAYGHQLGTSEACQGGYIVLAAATTDATATALRSNTNAAGSTNQIILPNNSAYAITGTVICRQSVAGSDKASGWTFTAVIRRGANAASTALVAAVTPMLIAQDVSLATTVLAVTADTTNGGLAVTVTGIAATNLRWVATIQTAECTYA